MYIVTGGRRSGKTSAIVRWMLEDPERRSVLCANEKVRLHIVQALRDVLPQVKWEEHVFAAYRLQGHSRGFQGMFGYYQVAIDDVQEVFAALFGAEIEFATMNATWIPLGPEEPLRVEVIQNKEIPGGTIIRHIEPQQ